MRTAIVLLLSLLAAPAPAQEAGQLADALVRSIRAHQQEDGSYGDLPTTARVLDLFARSPRHYTDLDGPFVRRAARWLVDQPPGDATTEAWRALGLAGAVSDELLAARERALERLLASAGETRELPVLLALHTFAPDEVDLHHETDGDDAARAVLVAPDPRAVAAPPREDVDAWAAWARAARLRGIVPDDAPDLPQPTPDAPLPELLDELEHVLAVHGVQQAARRQPAPDEPRPAIVAAPRPRAEALAAALDWLSAHEADGTFGLGAPGWSGPEPGVTALALSAALRTAEAVGRPRPDWVDDGLDYLVSLQKPGGAIYDYGVAVYTTSVAIEALLDGGRESDRPVVDAALQYLVETQSDEGEGYSPELDPHYGGIGYGSDERPDLSNTQMALEAAHRAGLPPDHVFWRRALVFLERNQNLGEVAARSWPRAGGGRIVSGTDGGATYMPGNSPAGEEQVGEATYVARSYGSMTYALTKSYLLCGLPPDDQRVSAAVDWLLAHWTLERNPGFTSREQATDGLYYYYLSLARTLPRLPPERVVKDGRPLDWRRQLDEHLRSRQRTDGSWINEDSSRWYEGSAELCTAYALLALSAAGERDG